jgi:hypothetical protein
VIDDPAYPCPGCGTTIEFPRSRCAPCEAEETRARRLAESRAWTERQSAEASEKSAAPSADRATAIAKHHADQLRGEKDVLAFYISVVATDHHSAVCMAGEYNHSLAEDPKADAHRAISELYEGMARILFYEMKTEEGRARVNDAFAILLEKKAEADAGINTDKVVDESKKSEAP